MKKWKISDFKTREEIQNEIDSLESSKQEHLEKDDLPSMYFEAIDSKLEKLYDKLESIKDMTESRLPSDGSDPEFGVPQEEKYPLYDKKHVISAIKLFGHVNPKYESQLAHAIIKRMKKYNIPFSMVGEDNNLHKYIPLTEQLIKKSKKVLLESDTVITNKIADVLDEIKDIKYGFINKNDGSRILDREWIHNTDDLNDYYEVNWDPNITLKNKLGICLDQSIAIKHLLNKYHPNIVVKIYALRKGRFGHAVPTFLDDDKYYYLENAWDKEMGMHGPFSTQPELENYLSGLYHKHHDKDNDDDVYVYPFEHENLTEGWKESEEENEKYVVNGKVFKTEEDADKYREKLEKEKLEKGYEYYKNSTTVKTYTDDDGNKYFYSDSGTKTYVDPSLNESVLYSGINTDLKNYLNKKILPMYNNSIIDNAHREDHILSVLDRAMKISNDIKLSNREKEIVYTAAITHDIGLLKNNRDDHNKASSEFVKNDKFLNNYFSRDEIDIIADAVEDHRASLKYDPRSIYGKVVSTADRNLNIDDIITRCIQYRLNQGITDYEDVYSSSYEHFKDKYGRNGYIKIPLKTETTSRELKKIYEYEDKNKFKKEFDKIWNMMDSLTENVLLEDEKPLSKIKSEYTQYVIQHKNNVIKGFNFIKQYVPEMLEDCDIGKLNGLIGRHDASKYSTDEFIPYAHFFYGNGRTQEVRDNFKKAWQHHWKNNPHHPEWWNMRDMSNEHIVEMICDWWSFGWKNNNMQELFDYYKSTDKRQYMSENTKKVLAKKMKMLRDKLRQMRLIK